MTAQILPLQFPVQKPRISVIMVSFMTGPALLEAITAVINDPEIFELVIVDNGNTYAARQKLSDLVTEHDKIRMLQSHGNIGFAKGCNYGVNFATGELLLFLNPDAVISPGSARRLAECGIVQKAPWIVGGLLRNTEGREQRGSRRRELTPASAFVSFTGLYKLPGLRSIHMEQEPVPQEPEDVAVVSGAFMMMDRDTFNSLDGFDENFFLHVEDIDVCRRVRELGGRVLFHPKASVMHYGSTSNVRRQTVEFEKLKGFVYYFRKHADGWIGRVMALLSIPFMAFAIMGRAWYLALRKAFRGA